MKKNVLKKNRATVLIFGGVIVFLIFIIKLYQLQIIDQHFYLQKANRQYTGNQNDFFDRNSIYFTDKDGNKVSAATIKTGYKLSINPSSIKNPEDLFNNLSNYIQINEEDFLKKASKKQDPYEEIAKRVDPDSVDKMIKNKIQNLSFYKENWRFYPGKKTAAQTIGFMSFKDNTLKAQYGLERYYDEVLEKRDSGMFRNFFVEIFSDLGKTFVENRKMKGSIVTTLEPTVQSFTESVLEKVNEKWHSNMTGAIIMNPKNGEIYTMAIDPSFDLNEFNQVKDVSIYSNQLVEGVYEMGSIMKPITMAIGIDTGSVNADTTYDDKGSVTLDGYTIHNYDKKARGVVNMQAVLNNSLNTGMVFVVTKVGNQKFANYMKSFFVDKTGIDLPNEGLSITNLDSPKNVDYATAGFGQGIAVTPISIIRALASLSNGGYLVHPHIVKSIDYDVGFSQDINFPKPKQIFQEKTSEEISRMLVKVVDEALRGGTVSLPNYSIAAKTGTAQIAKKGSVGYYDDRYLHSFFGYFPAYDPKFIIFLYTIEPKGVNYASETLTEPFMEIVKYLINYYDIPPDR